MEQKQLEGIVLALRLTQGFNLVGRPTIVGNTIKIQDEDDNPSFVVDFSTYTVELSYSNNLREIMVEGALKMIKDAGYDYTVSVTNHLHPLAKLLEDVKEKLQAEERMDDIDKKELKH